MMIRPMTITDYDKVVKLWTEAGLLHKPQGRDSREHILIELNRDTSVFLVAEESDNIVACVFGTHDGRKGWINRLAVHPDFRRSGLAKQLVSEVEKILIDKKIDIFACLIEENNDASMKLFEDIGYSKMRNIVYFAKKLKPEC